MNTIDLLNEHRSIRKYKNQAIEKNVLEQILEAGIRGSNTGNMQIYSIVVTQDKEKKKQLEQFHYQKQVSECAAVITVCVDINRYHKWCLQRNAGTAYDNFLWLLSGTVDATIVSQNICVAAEANGLGCCYLGTVMYNSPGIAKFLNLPKGVVPVTTLTMGYPDENPEKTIRLPLNAVVHYEEYHDYSNEDIDNIFKETEELPLSKEMVKINATENLAQIFTQKRYPKADNIEISKTLYQYYKENGFLD